MASGAPGPSKEPMSTEASPEEKKEKMVVDAEDGGDEEEEEDEVSLRHSARSGCYCDAPDTFF